MCKKKILISFSYTHENNQCGLFYKLFKDGFCVADARQKSLIVNIASYELITSLPPLTCG